MGRLGSLRVALSRSELFQAAPSRSESLRVAPVVCQSRAVSRRCAAPPRLRPAPAARTPFLPSHSASLRVAPRRGPTAADLSVPIWSNDAAEYAVDLRYVWSNDDGSCQMSYGSGQMTRPNMRPICGPGRGPADPRERGGPRPVPLKDLNGQWPGWPKGRAGQGLFSPPPLKGGGRLPERGGIAGPREEHEKIRTREAIENSQLLR